MMTSNNEDTRKWKRYIHVKQEDINLVNATVYQVASVTISEISKKLYTTILSIDSRLFNFNISKSLILEAFNINLYCGEHANLCHYTRSPHWVNTGWTSPEDDNNNNTENNNYKPNNNGICYYYR